jgi:heme/copper-type cytochrome/quinol oxidase subunit 2
MNSIFSLPENNVKGDWLIFFVMLVAIGLAVGIVVVWTVIYRPKKKKRKSKHRRRHSRQHNPTLAERGGLPPLRNPNQPPSGL